MIRRLTLEDLLPAMVIQAAVYPPEIQDGEAAFASRIAVAPDWCWAVETRGRLAAYLLSHPWTTLQPPGPDTVLSEAAGGVWYVHDLSVAPEARGQGLGDRLLAACRAAHPEIRRCELVAVPGAVRFWEKRGWRPIKTPALQAKIAEYGAGSAYMARDLS